MPKQVALFGYSGHAFVACEILYDMQRSILGYYELNRKDLNPFKLPYLGTDDSIDKRSLPAFTDFFVSIGENAVRKKLSKKMKEIWGDPINIIHPTAWVAKTAELGNGVMIAPNSNISSLVKIRDGVICNTSSTIEHECQIGEFAHIAPGATLCGNVTIGSGTLVGANAVVKPGITIGKNVIIGAGTVVVKPIKDNSIVIGNPQHAL